MDVTRATVADLDHAAPLFASYREFYGQPYDLDASRAFLHDRLAAGESVVFLAYDGDEAVGFVQVYPIFSSTRLVRVWLLNDLYVAEPARGSGVVDLLMNAVADAAREAGATEVELSTAHTNTRAQAVYERLGYERDQTFRTYTLALG